MRYTVGCVPFVNAKPLVAWFEHLGADSPVRVEYAVPSELPNWIETGRVGAALVSSFDAFARPGRWIARGACIGSMGPAASVRLFSKVPFESIRSLALDATSLTSNALARIVLAEGYGVWPEARVKKPGLGPMLEEADAAVLIGDLGLEADGAGLHVLDLGEAWTGLTGLPFVWAAWIGADGLTPELAGLLLEAGAWGARNMESIVREAAAAVGWPESRTRHYLCETMRYELAEPQVRGLEAFGDALVKHDLIAIRHPLEWVEAVPYLPPSPLSVTPSMK